MADKNNTTQPVQAKQSHGFGNLTCMYCSATDSIQIKLDNLTGEDALHCQECDTDYSVAEVRNKIEAWLPVLKWIEQAPVLTD